MKISDEISIEASDDGVAIECLDENLADELDDFLTERYGEDLLFNFEKDKIVIFLTDRKSTEEVELLVREFLLIWGNKHIK